MYQRYGGGNIDEGWSRLLLEQFSFAYTSVVDADIKKGNFNERFDVLIIPEDSTATITGDRPAAGATGGRGGRGPEATPPEFRTGIGTEGVDAIRAFVRKGGTLVALGQASQFAIERLGLPVRNVVAGLPTKDFYCPGSTLKVAIDTANPLGYGMPAEALAVYLQGNPVFEVTPTDHNEWYQTVAQYAARDILQSGWLVGEQNLAKKPAVVVARGGAGQVVLMGFRVQHRAQTHGTYKLLFNALLK